MTDFQALSLAEFCKTQMIIAYKKDRNWINSRMQV